MERKEWKNAVEASNILFGKSTRDANFKNWITYIPLPFLDGEEQFSVDSQR